MKRKILDALKSLGFKVNDLGENGFYGFRYESNNLMYMYNEHDEDFLNIAAPFVQEIDPDNELLYYQLMDNINSKLKYVKAYRMENDVWLFVEHELMETDDLNAILMSMIAHLDMGVTIFHDALAKIEADEDVDEE